MTKTYDFSKFKKFGLEEKDFKYSFKRISSCGSPELINDNNNKVEVIVEKLNLSISCFKTRSQLKNKDIALDMIYILLCNKIDD